MPTSGQGVGSIQPIMIAEEMDLDPGQFEIRFAGPSPAYFNTGFAHELAPFMAADQSPEAEKARAAALEWLRKSGLQMTGGSSTIPDTYRKAARGRRCRAGNAEGGRGQAQRRRGRRYSHRGRQRDPARRDENSLRRAFGRGREDSAGCRTPSCATHHSGD